MFRLLQAGMRVVWDHDVGAVIRQQRDSISNSSEYPYCKPTAWRNWIAIREQMIRYLDDRGELTKERLQSFQETIVRLVRLYRRQDADEALAAIARNREYMKRLILTNGHTTYWGLYNLFGFEFAERCREIWGKVRTSVV